MGVIRISSPVMGRGLFRGRVSGRSSKSVSDYTLWPLAAARIAPRLPLRDNRLARIGPPIYPGLRLPSQDPHDPCPSRPDKPGPPMKSTPLWPTTSTCSTPSCRASPTPRPSTAGGCSAGSPPAPTPRSSSSTPHQRRAGHAGPDLHRRLQTAGQLPGDPRRRRPRPPAPPPAPLRPFVAYPDQPDLVWDQGTRFESNPNHFVLDPYKIGCHTAFIGLGDGLRANRTDSAGSVGGDDERGRKKSSMPGRANLAVSPSHPTPGPVVHARRAPKPFSVNLGL